MIRKIDDNRELKANKNSAYAFTFVKIFMLSLLVVFAAACSSTSSSDDELVGNWYELSDYVGVPRADGVVFTIDSIAYIGLGWDGSDRLNDFWAYNANNNDWASIDTFPGVARNGAVAFSAGGKGYVGTGYDGTSKLKDFWEYDPASDTWTQIADFPGSARYGAVAFSIDDKGYVGTGYDGNNLKDLYEYDPASDTWTPKAFLGGGKRRDAVAFVINGEGYICTGVDNGEYENDFWKYNPVENTWTELREISNISSEKYDDDYISIVGTDKVAFAIGDKAYLATGGKSTAGSYVWEYDSVTDLWEQKTSLEASSRLQAVGFAIGDVGYIATGRNSSYYFDDLWGWAPEDEQVDLDKSVIVAP